MVIVLSLAVSVRAVLKGFNLSQVDKFQDSNKSHDKLYKVTLSSKGTIAVYENIRGATFLFGNFYREGLQVKSDILAQNEVASQDFAGFWIRSARTRS